MSVQIETIPLLTLPGVLFPGTFLPVDVTSDQQRSLLEACMEDEKPLGVVFTSADPFASPSVPYTVGCLASVAFLLYQNDAPVSAVLFGERRMRLIELVDGQPHPACRVELLDELDGVNAQVRTRQVSRLFQQYLTLIRQRYQADVTSMPLPDDPTQASYLLASALYLPADTKQRWLETATAALRLEEELAYLTEQCDRLSTFIALAQRTPHAYHLPDPQIYLARLSDN